MPSISQLRDIAVPVVVEHGALTITFQVGLERKSTKADEFKVLLQKQNTIEEHLSKLLEETNAVIGRNENLRVPDAADVLVWRERTTTAFKDITTILAAINLDEASELPGENITLARDAAQEALNRIDEWTEGLLLTPAQFDEQLAQATAQVKELAKQLDVERENRHKNQAAQIALLCVSWDLTETEEENSPKWPLTPENVASFSAPLLLKVAQEIAKKV